MSKRDVWLAHHGIKGQKWGIKNGPPYPLDSQSKSASEKKAVTGKRNSNEEKEKTGLTDRQKKVIKIGAAACATALAAAGTYYLYKNGYLDKMAEMGKNKTKELLLGDGSIPTNNQLDSLFSKSISNPNIRTDFKGINPNRNKPLSDVNFILKAKDGTPLQDCNCQACSLAYEIKRRMGKDVAAQLVDTREYSREYLMSKIYKNPKIEKLSINEWTDLDAELCSLGEGARGNLMISMPQNRHSLAFEVTGGRLAIFDTQIEQVFGTESPALNLFYRASKDDLMYVRTDNLEFNDVDFISSLVVEKRE